MGDVTSFRDGVRVESEDGGQEKPTVVTVSARFGGREPPVVPIAVHSEGEACGLEDGKVRSSTLGNTSTAPTAGLELNFAPVCEWECSVTRVEPRREGELVKIAASARSHWACRKYVGLVLCPHLADASTNGVSCRVCRSRRV